MNNRIQLLTVLKFILEEASESSPVSHSEITSFLESKGICLPKNTLTEDIKTIREAGFDLVTVKKGNTKITISFPKTLIWLRQDLLPMLLWRQGL